MVLPDSKAPETIKKLQSEPNSILDYPQVSKFQTTNQSQKEEIKKHQGII